MEVLLVSALTIFVLVMAPLVAHTAGLLTSRFLRVKPGAIRAWMPSIPDHIERDGAAEARWERRRRAVEARLLARFDGGVAGAEAHALAAELGEEPDVVAGALGHMREEIPARLRVTRAGKLLHDFSADAIASLRTRRRLALPARLAIFTLAVLANIGAAWPLIMGLLVAAGALAMIAVEGSAVAVGGVALICVAVLFVVNFAAGGLAHLLLTPGLGLTSRPRLGATHGAEVESSARLQEEQAAGWSMMDGGSSSSSVDPGCGSFGDLDEGIFAVIIVALLIAIVAACTFSIGLFLRGIWRAATGAGMPPLDMSPTQWLRSPQPSDSWERFIPTNDLVLRVTRVMRRLFSHTHPRDSTIIGRVMAQARQQNGRISALEVALQEGLDLDTATTIGAQLSGRADGRIDVTDGGELDFVFPADALRHAPAEWDDDLHAEYIDYIHAPGTLKRRPKQSPKELAVNLPGIAWSHVKSASRLAAGTVLMMLTGVAVVSLVPGVPLAVKLLVDSVLPLMVLGTFALAGALRYAVSSLAMIGVRRDIRRAAFLHIQRAHRRDHPHVEFGGLANNLLQQLRPAWRGLDATLIDKEITAVAIDLDLEPTEARGTYSLTTLRDRLADVAAHRAALEVELEFGAPPEDDDEVIFDSEIEHDRVRALA